MVINIYKKYSYVIFKVHACSRFVKDQQWGRFSHKNNKVINTLLDMLMIFWENNDSVPNYFILQILYNELIENYYKKEQCQIVSDTFPHEMFRVWFDKYSEERLMEIMKKSDIHKLSFKIENSKRKKDKTFFEYFEKMYRIN